MAKPGKKPESSLVQEDLPRGGHLDLSPTEAGLELLSIEELEKQERSMVDNLAAFRHMINRIATLEGYRKLHHDLLADLAEQRTAEAKKIADVLTQTTKEDETHVTGVQD